VGTRTSQTAVVNVLQKPEILVQPASQTVAKGETALLSLAAIGTQPLGYRWRKSSGTYLNTAEPVLSLINAVLTNAGTYDVIITNPATMILGGFARSSNAYVVVVIPPTNQQALPGSTVTLRAVGGAPPNFSTGFEWYFKGALLARGTNTTAQFTNDLVLTSVSNASAGAYTYLVTNFLGAPAAFTAALTVGNLVVPINLGIKLEGTNAVLTWEDAPGNWALEEARDLAGPAWKPSGAVPVLESGRWRAVVPVSGGTNTFLRLKSP